MAGEKNSDSKRIWVVDSCAICDGRHVYDLVIGTSTARGVGPVEAVEQDKTGGQPRVLVFGGRVPSVVAELRCPVTGRGYTQNLDFDLPGGQTVLGADALIDRATAIQATPESSVESEYQEWIRGSASLLRDYSKTMITVSTGAIPIFFALVGYLGIARAGNIWIAVSCATPLLLLAAAITFVDALRPRGKRLDLDSFATFRERRLIQIRTRVTVGTALFIGAVGVASGLALALLAR